MPRVGGRGPRATEGGARDRLCIGATPTFVINRVEVGWAVLKSNLRLVINRGIDAAVASSTPRAEYRDKTVLGL